MKSTKLYNIGQLVSYNSIKNKMICMKNVEIILEKSKIIEVGRNLNDADNAFDCRGMLVTPGFIDSHTHPVFLNSRNDEFMMRLNGDTYENINRKGGGILSSINDVRGSTKIELEKKVKNRMDHFLKLGTTTIECKSGYGLNKKSELKSLEIIENINKNHEIDMIPTFMGAHTIPPEYKSNPDSYVEILCNEIIPAIKKQGIAIFNDVFCEKGYFNEQQSIKILNCGKNHGLIPRLHADEFKNSSGAKVAYETNAISADHLMAVSDEGLNYLKKGNTIATLLPGTTFFLGKNTYAPYDKIRRMGIEVALATDFNPGSCYVKSIPFIMSLACIYLKMPILETLKSVTYVAAKSLRLEEKVGSIEKNMVADILIWNARSLEKIITKIPNPSIYQIIKNGKFLIKS